MRPDLIGEGYAAALAQLQDNVEPFDSATAMAILQQELGAPPGEIFSAITPQPIASASLGQVRRHACGGNCCGRCASVAGSGGACQGA